MDNESPSHRAVMDKMRAELERLTRELARLSPPSAPAPAQDAPIDRFRSRAERADAAEVPVLASDEAPSGERCATCDGGCCDDAESCPDCNGTGRKGGE